MLTRIVLTGVLALGLSTAASAQELETQKDKFSYTIGYQMGLSLQRPGMEVNQDVLVQALRDALSGNDPQLSRSQMDAAIAEQRRMLEGERQEKASENLARGEEFLEQNKARDAVTETESGLQYEVITEGEGAQPTESDTVVVHYEGSTIDGEVFDSSYERDNPATLALNGVIEGWKEGLQLMHEGAKYKLYIPANLAYGEQGAGGRIGPNQTLVFEVELIEVK
jgi:FKBP-type peptidyl-prolyl cis-trans isomerase